jgi:putative ABC transport system ATP-binding protein
MSIALNHIRFSWDASEKKHLCIDELRMGSGERWFVEGVSGSGKSTLLSVLSGVAIPQAGTVTMLDQELSSMGAVQRDRFRADHMGYIFQQFNLIPFLSVIENVTLPLRFSAKRAARVQDAASEAARLMAALGMEEHGHQRVMDLSVGQQQRVAAARALIGAPEIILADEPTSALDAVSSEAFMNLLFDQCREMGSTLVVVSHDHRLAEMFDHRYTIQTP